MTRLLLILPLLFAALARTGEAQTATRAADKAVPRDTVITLERGACFGTCPIYKVTVYGDGRVVYLGKDFVKVKGTVRSRVTRAQVKQLLDEFEKADYFSLRDSYNEASDGCPMNWTDNPSANTSLRLGGRAKSISHNYGCREKVGGNDSGGVYPKKLYELEGRIDEILNTARWVKGARRGNPQR